MHELAAWILFPLIALAILVGVGLLAERVARAEVHGALIPGLGLAGSIVVLGPLYATGVRGVFGTVLLALLAAAGWVLGDRRRPRFGALAGLATYALHIAPVALTGSATFLGYNLLNDTAVHLSLVDWISDHGSHYVAGPPSSYTAAMARYVGIGYPLGSHELLAALKPFVGMDPAAIYQPFLALCAAVAAAAIYALVAGADPRPAIDRRVAAYIGFAAMASQLIFSFALQGSIKELAFIACLATAAGVARSPVLLALPAAALFGIYGVASLAWIVPLVLAALVLTRPAIRSAAIAVAIFVVAIAALIPSALDYYNEGNAVLTSGQELGPLGGPLKLVQVAGVWWGGDYRFTPAHSAPTYLVAIAVLVAAVTGLAVALRRRHAPVLLFAIPALVAAVATAPASSPYIDAKLLAILSPAVLVAAFFAISSIPRPRAALVAAALLGLALLVSDALAYRLALPAPVDRFAELTKIDERFAGQGPILVNEFEEYIKHYMRTSRGSDPYENATAARADLRDRSLPVAAHRYDLDQMRTSYIERWRLIVLRRSPVESRPPSNYDRVWHGRWYEVWKRTRPAPAKHLALGKPPFDPTEPLDCKLARSLSKTGSVVVALRPKPVVIDIAQARPLPPGWYVSGSDPLMLEIHKGGTIALPSVPAASHLWARGRTTRKTFGIARSFQRITEWIDLGSGTVDITRPKRSLRPGDAQPDIIGPLVAVGPQKPVLVRGATVRQACGAPADWIDVLPR